MVVGILFVTGDPCLDNPCTPFVNGTELSMCVRFDGFNFQCAKPTACDIIDCGEYGDCVDGICKCDNGYVVENNFCKETCALNPCQELNLRLRSSKNT